MDRVRHLSLLSQARMINLIAEHEDIVGHLRLHSVDAADASIVSHLTSVGDDIAAIAREFPDYFSDIGV